MMDGSLPTGLRSEDFPFDGEELAPRTNNNAWPEENMHRYHSVKLTFSPLEIDDWNTTVSFSGKRPIFRGDLLLVSGRVSGLDIGSTTFKS